MEPFPLSGWGPVQLFERLVTEGALMAPLSHRTPPIQKSFPLSNRWIGESTIMQLSVVCRRFRERSLVCWKQVGIIEASQIDVGCCLMPYAV